MKAAVLYAANKVEVANVDMPKAGPGDLVIKVKAAAICGTDGRILTGKKTKGVRYPSVIGHEFSGEIVEIGEGVTAFQCGDAVTVDPVIPCCSCVYCRTGKENVCLNRQAIGYEFDGAFAEYLRIPAIALKTGNVFPIPKGISYAAAALAEPLACCINGQKNMGIKLGDTIVIMGAGPIGLMHIMLAKLAGATTVIVSEINENRRKAALECGADIVIDPSNEDLSAKLNSLTNGIGADGVIMAIGVPALVNPALSLVKKGGRVNLFAGFSTGATAEIDINLIHYNEIIVTGASALSREGYQIALNLITSKNIDVEKLITHRFSLKDAIKAFTCAQDGAAIKVLITDE